MFEVCVEEMFAAGHALRGYKGKCENVHGHNYRVMVTVVGDGLDGVGMLCDFGTVKKQLRAVVAKLDHQFLNDLEPFTVLNPSAENLAKYFHDEIAPHLPDVARVTEVRVWETPTSAAAYRP